ncbi:MAG: class I SAM-dependent methyltransferase [Myxococcota bacterium]
MPNAWVEFVKAAARRPRDVATVFPTSPQLARRLARAASEGPPGPVVELGAGTGAITRHLREVSPELVTVEIDPDMAAFLRARFPEVRVVSAHAEDLRGIVGRGSAKAVVASLPWSLLPLATVDRILAAVHESLAPGGVFATYLCVNAAWHPRARAFTKRVRAHFPDADEGPLEWRNLPPAIVWTARREAG